MVQRLERGIYEQKHDASRLVEVVSVGKGTVEYKEVNDLLTTPYSVPTAYFLNNYKKSSEYD